MARNRFNLHNIFSDQNAGVDPSQDYDPSTSNEYAPADSPPPNPIELFPNDSTPPYEPAPGDIFPSDTPPVIPDGTAPDENDPVDPVASIDPNPDTSVEIGNVLGGDPTSAALTPGSFANPGSRSFNTFKHFGREVEKRKVTPSFAPDANSGGEDDRFGRHLRNRLTNRG